MSLATKTDVDKDSEYKIVTGKGGSRQNASRRDNQKLVDKRVLFVQNEHPTWYAAVIVQTPAQKRLMESAWNAGVEASGTGGGITGGQTKKYEVGEDDFTFETLAPRVQKAVPVQRDRDSGYLRKVTLLFKENSTDDLYCVSQDGVPIDAETNKYKIQKADLKPNPLAKKMKLTKQGGKWIVEESDAKPPYIPRMPGFVKGAILICVATLIVGCFLLSRKEPQQSPLPPNIRVVKGMRFTDFEGEKGKYFGPIHRAFRKPHGVGAMTYRSGRECEGKWKYGKLQDYGFCRFENNDEYEGEIKDHKMNGHGTYKYANGRAEYVGEWKNDEPNGHGVITIARGTTINVDGSFVDADVAGSFTVVDDWKYEGSVKGGMAHGYGVMSTSGFKYAGEFRDDMLDGQGIFFFVDGSVYNGTWKNNLRDGHGIMKWTSGSTYNGTWEDDMMNGQGTFFDVDGSVYNGTWENDLRNGQGIMKWTSGNTYNGTWKDNMMNGQGIMTFLDGSEYNGHWSRDVMSGEGKRTYADGSSYKGTWKDGKKNGQGVAARSSDGFMYDGSWKDDMMNGRGFATYHNGDTHSGKFKNGMSHGHGVYFFHDGNCKYDGNFKNGMSHGSGTLTYADGDSLKGHFTNGDFKANSRAVYTYANGTKINMRMVIENGELVPQTYHQHKSFVSQMLEAVLGILSYH